MRKEVASMDMDSMVLDWMLEEDRRWLQMQKQKASSRSRVRQSQAKRRAQAAQKGLCRQCCTSRALPGKTLCAACRDKQQRAQRQYLLRKRISGHTGV